MSLSRPSSAPGAPGPVPPAARRPGRRRGALAGTVVGALAGALALASCDEVPLQVQDPDILDPTAFRSAAGMAPLRAGAIGDFALAFAGFDGAVVIGGNLADEIRATDSFESRLSVDARAVSEINPEMEVSYRNLHRAHNSARVAAELAAEFQPQPRFLRGELYALRGFVETFFHELYCDGVPFSRLDGATPEYGEPSTRAQLLARTTASFDTALTLADTSTRVRWLASVGRARTLLNLGRPAEAAAAVRDVPTSFRYQTTHSTTSLRQENRIFDAVSQTRRYAVASRDGGNGLPYLQTPPDPRMPWTQPTPPVTGFDQRFTNLPRQLKYPGRTSPVTLADGVEARLVEAEAQLALDTPAGRAAMTELLNGLRTTAITPALPRLTAPASQAEAVDLLFAERAYWLWLTGHRLGDLRRLVRQYGRNPESVFPSGALPVPRTGNYGRDVNLPIPFEERNNPKFSGCLNRSA